MYEDDEKDRKIRDKKIAVQCAIDSQLAGPAIFLS
jgi:hypothetical protein